MKKAEKVIWINDNTAVVINGKSVVLLQKSVQEKVTNAVVTNVEELKKIIKECE